MAESHRADDISYAARMVRLAAELLSRHPLLTGLDRPQLELLSRKGELESYAPEEVVVERGSLGDALYLVLSGRVGVFAGESLRPLATLEPGEFFGEMSLVEPALRSATVRASAPLEVFRLPHVAVQQLFETDPALMNRILVHVVRALSRRLRRTNDLVGSVEQLSEWLAGSML
jgi:CRP-like cAMP-binding protein